MNRRNALRLLGVMVATLGGRAVQAEDSIEGLTTTGDLFTTDDMSFVSGPMDFRFEADNLRSVIFTREGKPDLVIPFADIIKELEEDVNPQNKPRTDCQCPQ